MRKTNYVTIALDVLMGLLFALFFNTRVLGGQPFHEMAGLIFTVMYFTHILLNWKWVLSVTRGLFRSNMPWRTRGNFALNFLLLISMTFVIVSGVLSSEVIFPNIHVEHQKWFLTTHVSVSFLVLLLLGIHVGIHWHWVLNVWNKIWRHRPGKVWVRYLAQGLTTVILVFGIYTSYNTKYWNQLEGVVSVIGVQTPSVQIHGDRIRGSIGEGFQNPLSNPNFHRGFRRGFRGGMRASGRANVLSVIATYTGIMAVFVIVTYYLRRFFIFRRKKEMAR